MINLIFFINILLTLGYLLDVLCFFNKKQPLILINKWIILLGVLIISVLWTYVFMKSNANVIKIQSNMITDFNKDNIHDSICKCDYCTEINIKADYYIQLGDSSTNYGIYLVRPEDNDTIANLSSSKLLRTIIDEDNL